MTKMKLTKFPGWEEMTPTEKKRFKKVFAPRLESEYDLNGRLSTTKKELEHNE